MDADITGKLLERFGEASTTGTFGCLPLAALAALMAEDPGLQLAPSVDTIPSPPSLFAVSTPVVLTRSGTTTGSVHLHFLPVGSRLVMVAAVGDAAEEPRVATWTLPIAPPNPRIGPMDITSKMLSISEAATQLRTSARSQILSRIGPNGPPQFAGLRPSPGVATQPTFSHPSTRYGDADLLPGGGIGVGRAPAGGMFMGPNSSIFQQGARGGQGSIGGVPDAGRQLGRYDPMFPGDTGQSVGAPRFPGEPAPDHLPPFDPNGNLKFPGSRGGGSSGFGNLGRGGGGFNYGW